MIVISEASDQLTPSSSARDIAASTEAARLAGCRLYYIPQDFDVCQNATNALCHVPEQARESPGIWIGYIPAPEKYEDVYRAALDKRIRLLNNPAEHLRAQEFDAAYSRLLGLTPKTCIIHGVEECAAAVASVGLPVFVKGAVQSRKARGWKACVAYTLAELEELTRILLDLKQRSRGRVVVRELVRLRHTRKSAEDFPIGREYRLFIYEGRVVGSGYYWEGDDPLKELSKAEQAAVESLAREAAARLEVPYITVDIGQKEDGDWIVIETGDAQFSGVSQIPLLKLWHQLSQLE
ncbi:MAG TPA: ATP-grasp domain-containing protein [Chthoniobacteraceae bacterium]|nr:ATP-grasp domain-containing protein [Chthoniobacteraceae bacterium]